MTKVRGEDNAAGVLTLQRQDGRVSRQRPRRGARVALGALTYGASMTAASDADHVESMRWIAPIGDGSLAQATRS